MSVDSLRNELEQMNKALAELQADNTMVKIAVNTLVERLDELESDKGSRRAKSAPRKKKSASAASIEVDDAPEKKKKKKKKDKGSKMAARLAKEQEQFKSDQKIDPDRFGTYTVGKRNVQYVTPDGYTTSSKNDKSPKKDLTLDFIYGYNGKNARSNLFFTDKDSATPRLVYCVAGAGVYFDPAQRSQAFFTGHNEDISAFAIHPKKPIAATGQLDPKGAERPYVCVWDYHKMKELARIGDFHDRGIAAIGFSGNGKYLATVGDDDSHTVAIWDWAHETKEPLVSQMTSKDSINGLEFNPFSDTVEFVTFGTKHLKVWTMTKKKSKVTLSGKIASSYNDTGVIQKGYYSAVYLPDGAFVVGTATGELYVFDGTGKFLRSIKHSKKGSVGGLCRTDDGFASGGSDGRIVMFDSGGKKVSSVDLGAMKIKSLDYCSANGGMFVAGGNDNSITQFVVGQNPTTLMRGHCGELWALAVHPTLTVIATGAHDKVLQCWDYKNRMALPDKRREFKGLIRSCAFSPDGRQIALGFMKGKVAIIDYETFEVEYEKRHRSERIDAINFSPNGQLLALGSWDQCVELIDLESRSSVALKGHTSSVTHITFSADSKYLASNSKDYEILYWDCETGKRVGIDAVVDVTWGDWQNVLGWPVKGVFAKGMDGTDINAANISGQPGDKTRSVATGDDFGRVALYAYPVINKSPKVKRYPGHSSHVTNVRFSPDDQWLFSGGGLDMGVFQWKHR